MAGRNHQTAAMAVTVIVIVGVLALIIRTQLHKVSLGSAINASSCPTNMHEQVGRADLIMTGSVAMVVPGATGQAKVIVTPSTVYKGRVDTPTLAINALDDATIASAHVTVSTIHFQSGQPPYLLFLHAQPDGTFTTHSCDGTRFFGSGLTLEERQALGTETISYAQN